MTKDSALYIRIDQTIKDKLNEICKREHRTQSEQISYWIENYKLEKERTNGTE